MRILKWLARKQVNTRQLVLIILIFLLGLAFGIFATGRYGEIKLSLTHNNDAKVKQLIEAFTQNFWYFFLLWLTALIPLGFVLSYLIVFLKGFIFGVTFGLIIKAEALFGVYSFFKLLLWQILILIPLFIYLSYHVVNVSTRTLPGYKTNRPQLNFNTYLTLLLIVTIGILLFSFLVAMSSIRLTNI